MPTATQNDVAAVVAAFRLTDAEIAQLGRILYEQARVPTYTARYRRVAKTAQASLPPDWQPAEHALATLATEAVTNAQAIADTYHADLDAQARYLLADQKALPKDLGAVIRGLADWAHGRAASKSVQIANYEASDAGDAGTFDAIADLVNGDITPGLDLDHLRITVLPLEASSDICSAYAGLTFDLSEWEDISGRFPAHANCPHEAEVYAT